MSYGLVLFPKDAERDVIEPTMGEIQTRLGNISHPMTLVDSSAWFQHSFARFGSYESWVYETVVGIDYSTRKPRYDAFFVVGDGDVGLATANIVQLALTNKRPVLRWDSTAFHPVRGVSLKPSSDSTFTVC